MSFKDDIDNFIPEVERHFRAFLAGHSGQIERGIKLAEMADADPAIQAFEAALGIPAPVRAAFGDLVTRLDAEFQRVTDEAHEAGRVAGHAQATAELAPPAPETPGEPAAEVPPAG